MAFCSPIKSAFCIRAFSRTTGHSVKQALLQNKILATLPEHDFERLSDHLEPVKFASRQHVLTSNKPITHAYFVESGIVSVVASPTRRKIIEVGFVGREGFTGLPIVMGSDSSPYSAFVQVGGHGLRISSNVLREITAESTALRESCLRYAHVFLTQVASSAAANSQGKLEERLARWLLMAHDRLHDNDLPLTHELLSMMLGVHRPGVTIALSLLSKRGMIAIGRGAITITDRSSLQKFAGGYYGDAENEERKLLGETLLAARWRTDA